MSTPEYASADELTSDRAGEEDFMLPSGRWVRVRGLSRGEVYMMQKSKADGGIKDEASWERRMVHLALIQPPLTEEQVGNWQQGPAGGDLEQLTDKIRDLSKLGEGAEKSGVPGSGDES